MRKLKQASLPVIITIVGGVITLMVIIGVLGIRDVAGRITPTTTIGGVGMSHDEGGVEGGGSRHLLRLKHLFRQLRLQQLPLASGKIGIHGAIAYKNRPKRVGGLARGSG